MQKRSVLIGVGVVVGIALAAVVYFAFWPENETVRIAAAQRNASAQIYVALEKGFFHDEGLTIDLVEPLTAAGGVQALESGSVDVAVSSQMPVIAAALEKKPLRIMASLYRTERRVGLVVGKGVKTVADLKGRKVGIARDTNAELLLRRLLHDEGLATTDLVIEDVPAEQVPQVFAEGKIDAAAVYEPFLGIAASKIAGSQVLYAEGSFSDVWMLLTTPRFEKGRPEVARRLLRALSKATAYIYAHPAESREITMRHQKTPELTWDDSAYRLRLFDSLPTTLVADAGLLVSDPGQMPDFRALLCPELLRAVVPSSVSLSQ